MRLEARDAYQAKGNYQQDFSNDRRPVTCLQNSLRTVALLTSGEREREGRRGCQTGRRGKIAKVGAEDIKASSAVRLNRK